MGNLPTHTSVYHSQSNLAERLTRELDSMFRTFCSEQHTEWPRFIEYNMKWVLNHTRHESTSLTPAELFLNQRPFNPLSQIVKFPPGVTLLVDKKITMAAEVQRSCAARRKARHDNSGTHVRHKIGDLVLVRTYVILSPK